MSDFGPSMAFFIPRESFNYERVLRLKNALTDTDHFKIPLEPGELEDAAKRIAYGILRNVDGPDFTGLPSNWGAVSWDWKPWHEIGPQTPLLDIPFSRMNLDTYGTFKDPRVPNPPRTYLFRTWRPGQATFSLWFGRRGSRVLGPFPPDDDPKKIELLLGKWKEAANIFEPEFAAIDDYDKGFQKRRNKDVRQFVFGVTIYGPELVKRIGKERLLGVPAWRVEELSWGGVWVQASRNSFETPPETKRAIERHLDLRGHFANA